MSKLLLFQALTDGRLAELSEKEVLEYAMAAGRAYSISEGRGRVRLL